MRYAPAAYPPDVRRYKSVNTATSIKDVVKQLREEARLRKVQSNRVNYAVGPDGDVEMLPPLPPPGKDEL